MTAQPSLWRCRGELASAQAPPAEDTVVLVTAKSSLHCPGQCALISSKLINHETGAV